MADREVRIRFTGDSKVLKGSAGEVRQVFQKLIEDEDDARGAGEKLAAAQKIVAEKMRAEMKGVSEAADVLADSLGPEMVAAIEASGRSVEDEVVKFQNLGLTLTDIVRDSDLLAQGMKDLDDAARMSTGSIGDGFKKVAVEADKSRSVMANFVGNAAQEIPGLSGAFGPLNMAIGQFAEYAAEGDINLKGMAATAGPMLGVGAAVWYINNQLDLMRKKEAFRSDRVKAYEDVIRKAGSAAKNMTDHLVELGKVETQTTMNAGNPFADSTRDITDELLRAGLTVEDYSRLVVGGQEKIKAWTQTMRDGGADMALIGDVTMALLQDTKDYDEALGNVARSQKFFGTGIETLGEKAERAAGKHRTLAEQIERVGRGWEELNKKLSNEQGYLDGLDALDGLTDTWLQLVADVQSGAKTGEEAQRDWRQAILDTEGVLDGAVQQMANFPASIGTQINLWMDEGQWDKVRRRYEFLYRISGQMKDSSWFGTTVSPSRPGAVQMRATGGQTEAGQTYRVAEHAPEVWTDVDGNTYLVAGQNGKVTPLTGRSPAGAGTTVVHQQNTVHINAQGMTADQLVVALKEHLRRNGGEL